MTRLSGVSVMDIRGRKFGTQMCLLLIDRRGEDSAVWGLEDQGQAGLLPSISHPSVAKPDSNNP